MTLAELVADVAARHVPKHFGVLVPLACAYCSDDVYEEWPCDAARLAAALSVESVAEGLFSTWARTTMSESETLAAALLDAITEADR